MAELERAPAHAPLQLGIDARADRRRHRAPAAEPAQLRQVQARLLQQQLLQMAGISIN